MKWLDEHVITDQVYNIIEVVAWEALWDQAKKLRKREIDDLESQYKSQPVSLNGRKYFPFELILYSPIFIIYVIRNIIVNLDRFTHVEHFER